MVSFQFLKNRISFIQGCILLLIIAAVASAIVIPHNTRAVVPVHCPADPCRTWDVALSGELGSVCWGWFVSKEFIDIGCTPSNSVDSQYWEESVVILQEFKDAFIEWVRTGQDDFFTGGTRGTLFVTNIDEFKLDAADNQAAVFKEEYFGDAYSSLCRPYRDLVGEGIFTNYGRDYESFKNKARCTIALDEDISIEAFRKNFQNGGWKAWFQMGTYANNSVFTLKTLAEEEKLERESRAAKANELDFIAGQGFPGLRACEELTPEGLCWKYQTNTPGSVIQNLLVIAFETELAKEVAVDEAEEIVVDSMEEFNAWIWNGGSGGKGLLQGIGPGGGGQEQHAECQENKCVVVKGRGTNQCDPTSPDSCGQAQHAICLENNQCAVVPGPGTNQCDPTSPDSCGEERGYCVFPSGTFFCTTRKCSICASLGAECSPTKPPACPAT